MSLESQYVWPFGKSSDNGQDMWSSHQVAMKCYLPMDLVDFGFMGAPHTVFIAYGMIPMFNRYSKIVRMHTWELSPTQIKSHYKQDARELVMGNIMI